jgi:predicted ATPase
MLVTRASGDTMNKHNRKQLLQNSLDDVSKHSHHSNISYSYSARGTLNRSSIGDNKLRRKSKRLEGNINQSLHRRTSHTLDYGRLAAKESVHTAQDDSSNDSVQSQRQSSMVPYFEKLCQVCEELEYPFEYADIVGSQFLGFDCASPVTHIDGHVPTMDELVEFLALSFIQITHFSQFRAIFLDDFQWVDGFSWRVFREICNRDGKILLICATRSHDKQALRRISNAATPDTPQQSQMIEISLGPFDFTDIRELMANVLLQKKSTITDNLCSDIIQRTGGLPVFVIQLLENIKRMRTLELVDGTLQWTAEGLKQKVSQSLCLLKLWKFRELILRLFLAEKLLQHSKWSCHGRNIFKQIRCPRCTSS